MYSPYTDDPEAGAPYDPGMMLQTQKRMMDGRSLFLLRRNRGLTLHLWFADQDMHLDNLSHSLNRQHGLSLAINTEIEEHHGLLEQLDTEVDNTHSRLSGARKRLDRVARGVKGNGGCS